MKKLHQVILLIVCSFFIIHMHAYATDTLWNVQSIDTMKLSRDSVKDTHVDIASWVKKVADLHANYIAIDTPYDEEFYPVLKKWVTEARKNNLHVWFRGNFSGWEGWFNYPKLQSVDQHYKLTQTFIIKHPDIFLDGDIYTPAPEPENGIIGDPRISDKKAKEFNTFLITSYTTCLNAMTIIHKHVACGYFSVNGDIAHDILTKETVNILGEVVIDHYVNNVTEMTDEVDYLYQKFNKPIIIGEFGAPLDDINGQMDEKQQAEFVRTILQSLYIRKTYIQGFNYWVINGGSTELFTTSGGQKQVATVLKNYFNPETVSGAVQDGAGASIKNIIVNAWTNNTKTDKNGYFSFLIPRGTALTISINDKKYKQYSHTLLSNQNITNITLQSVKSTASFNFLEILNTFLSFFSV